MREKNKVVNKHFRFSESDAERLRRMAERNGTSESACIRLLLSSRPSDHEEIKDALDRLITEIHKIGTNVNQIAHACNVNPIFYNGDREKLMYYMRSCRGLLLEVVKYCNHEADAHVPGEGE